MMSKEKKQVYIQEMKTTFDKSEAVIVAHYQGLTVSQLDDLRSKMREHGIQFKITKNRIIKLALENTLNTMITETVEGLNFVLPGYQNGEKARVILQFSASVNY